jgi:hypothetical protein
MPAEIRSVFSDRLYLDDAIWPRACCAAPQLAAFQNPSFYGHKECGSRHTANRASFLARKTPGTAGVPRGCFDALRAWSAAQVSC